MFGQAERTTRDSCSFDESLHLWQGECDDVFLELATHLGWLPDLELVLYALSVVLGVAMVVRLTAVATTVYSEVPITPDYP